MKLRRRLQGVLWLFFFGTVTASDRYMGEQVSFRKIRTGVTSFFSTSISTAITEQEWGASHQTGWTGIIARIIHMFVTTTAEQVTALGQGATIVETESEWSAHVASNATR